MKRFWDKVNKTKGCWLFTGALNSGGYGSFWYDKQIRGAHRVSWTLANKSVPEGYDLCHKCDVRNCVRPSHLFVGTRSENIHDCIRKKRHAFGDRCGARKFPERMRRFGKSNHFYQNPQIGELHGGARLTETQVLEIRQRYTNGEFQKDLAREISVTQAHISAIVLRKTWKHV